MKKSKKYSKFVLKYTLSAIFFILTCGKSKAQDDSFCDTMSQFDGLDFMIYCPDSWNEIIGNLDYAWEYDLYDVTVTAPRILDPFPPEMPRITDTYPSSTTWPQPESKDDELSDELDKNPDLLIDCDLLKKFKPFINLKPPETVINRINDLNANSNEFTLFSNPYFVQQIKNAAGYKINLDRFEININTLPIVNGSRLSPDEFLKYIRKNFNDFFDTSIAEFTPYNDPDDGIRDASRWASDSPLGVILHLKMDDNGSVIVSDFAPNYWTVSTLRTPIDDTHPVSGNRQWGYEFGTNGNFSGYTFYVTGVDRLTTGMHELTQYIFDIPFTKADRLWESYQAKVSNFVNNHSGSATIGIQIKERPDYESLKDYLSGKITLQQLKDKKGCK